ncbi:hypothetical protein ACJIZ3_021456 [Penstemon smallii]|uniref:Uncharacterized protein n=1 Tax=Penstemon smallii TaxID=265156 RepID=A0ABD3SMC1_9LAMI
MLNFIILISNENSILVYKVAIELRSRTICLHKIQS